MQVEKGNIQYYFWVRAGFLAFVVTTMRWCHAASILWWLGLIPLSGNLYALVAQFFNLTPQKASVRPDALS
jgi:uncharacterized membrane protein YgdD (TMEM256/DUF423 family)